MPQLSAEELRAAEAEASYTVQQVVATAVALYLCMFLLSPAPVAPHSSAALSYGRWTIADISSASPLRRRRHLEDLLSTGDPDESSYNSLLHQLEHTCTILDRRYHGSSACMAAHSPHRHAFGISTWTVASDIRLGNAWHPGVSYGQAPHKMKELE